MRAEILKWLHHNEMVLKLSTGTTPFPSSFRARLESIANRGAQPPEFENTHGQVTQLMTGREYRSRLAMLLAEGGSTFGDVVKLVSGGLDGIHQMNQSLDVGLLGLTTLRIAQKANAENKWETLVEEMQAITAGANHLKQEWGPEADGTVLLVPESTTMHRRDGKNTGQVVWHTDSLGGTIVFCKEHGAEQPRRMLFSAWK